MNIQMNSNNLVTIRTIDTSPILNEIKEIDILLSSNNCLVDKRYFLRIRLGLEQLISDNK